MIASLRGKLIACDVIGMTCVIECGGVGYALSVTSRTVAGLPMADENGSVEIKLFTHMQVKEDGIELFGFTEQDELKFFKLLITVSGVGPKAAMAILSLYPPDVLCELIANEDTKAISKAQGVGAKIAGRVVLELHDKVMKEFPVFVSGRNPSESKKFTRNPVGERNTPSLSDARDALTVLGYSQADANSALSSLDSSLSTDKLIRKALAILSK